ncbi:nucleoside/nucleotide kinase family protein [Roseobacter sinensis]|uniref:Uncharacterized protein n=1 Tax=Roseobacter sinensis TaxID=2931391 RepID=A0ABT3BBG9_9RHOB|nr:hypothetical protein [Roseobacter sp. WL0113]MCV3270759.1 hypothetical protein [Roseobacter sp. WL0113]
MKPQALADGIVGGRAGHEGGCATPRDHETLARHVRHRVAQGVAVHTKALCRARPDLHRVRRVITRPGVAGGEAFCGIDLAEFEGQRPAGGFLLAWRAHDLHYGIPRSGLGVRKGRQDALANLSRGVLQKTQAAAPQGAGRPACRAGARNGGGHHKAAGAGGRGTA